LLDLADRVEKGVPLDQAISTTAHRLPVYLRALITAGIRNDRLPEALEHYVDLERTQHDLNRQIWINLAYPTILMIVMSILALLANLYITHLWNHVLRDFGTDLPAITRAVLSGSWPFTCVLFIVTALMLAIPLILAQWPGSSWISPALYYVPFIGKLLKSSQMARFSRLMAMLLQQQVPLPESLRLTANGLHDAYLTRACRTAAKEIEQGRSISSSIAARKRFSLELRPLIELGERASILGDAFQSAADLFEGRANTQGHTLGTILLPCAFLFIICFYGVFVIALFMPLISLITHLTGGH
jgi:type II secretory pathway component PulF